MTGVFKEEYIQSLTWEPREKLLPQITVILHTMVILGDLTFSSLSDLTHLFKLHLFSLVACSLFSVSHRLAQREAALTNHSFCPLIVFLCLCQWSTDWLLNMINNAVKMVSIFVYPWFIFSLCFFLSCWCRTHCTRMSAVVFVFKFRLTGFP